MSEPRWATTVEGPPPVPAQPVDEQPVSEAALRRVLAAMTDLRDGNFRRRLPVTGDGVLNEIAATFNEVAERNQKLVGDLVELRHDIGGGRWANGRVEFEGDPGSGWAMAADSVNGLLDDTLGPTAELSHVLSAVANGDLSRRVPSEVNGRPLPGGFSELSTVVNGLLDQLSSFATEITKLTWEIGTEGSLGGQVEVPGLAGTWRDLADSVNTMASSLTNEVRDLSRVATAVARGDLSTKVTVEMSGELLEVKTTMNTMVDQLSSFAGEVTRVAHEVASEGRLGGQAEVPDASGTWRGVVDAVNFMAHNLTAQVRNIAQVATAVATGDLSQKIDVDARGEILQLKNTINTMVDQLSAFADEVTRVAREVGTDGRLGGQARVHGVAGTWKDLTDKVNTMADNLTNQVRSIATVSTAVAGGDLSKKITVEAKGEVAGLADTINQMVDTLRAFAEQVTLVAREVGSEGILGRQARVPNVAGTWKDLTDNVNFMARNLTSQVRNIAQVTTAVANGDLSKKIDVDARGEILELKTTVNTMVDRLSAFADEVTRVAREVGTEGKLGGQAEVIGVSGTWERLTERVNHLAGNLTTQVRAIAAVATAVTNGDLTRQITVDASGEVAELKDNINQMIENLKETTRTNQEQDWLKTNLARISSRMQGQHNLADLAMLIMRELTPLVQAQYGAFFLAHNGQQGDIDLERTATYGLDPLGEDGSPLHFRLGESLVGQAALDKKTVLVNGAPPHYVRIASGLGSTAPVNVIVLPALFEDQVLGVIELGSVNPFTAVHRDLLEQLSEAIGVNVTTILANSRTEVLLSESQHLTHELQARSEQLQHQQEELKRSNTELEEKAALLASRNRDIEVKNSEIEQARQELEERARQLTVASRYKSEFLANMSHELRTPLNSALLLAKLLGDNLEGNLTPQQVGLVKTIHSAGSDLLQLINDVLDLAKVEAGHMELMPQDVELLELAEHIESLYQPLAADEGLDFSVDLSPEAPESLETDKNRLEQVLRNLLANAVKFTEEGEVRLHIRRAEPEEIERTALKSQTSGCLAFAVHDTGIGIPQDKLSLIFEAFQQVDGTVVRKYGGTGLGLSISRELTSLLGGELHVTSEPGQGSTFTLFLPVVPDSSSGPAVLEAAPYEPALSELARVTEDDEQVDEPQGFLRFHGERVLIVDDDRRGIFALTTVLEQHGLRVLHADNGMVGLQTLQEHEDIRAVLMDLMMPELDGTSAISTIRSIPRYQDLPIITVTAKAMKGDREASMASGANDYVTKPVDAAHLLQLLAQHLGAEDA
jgi:signal transduction histidine kinase/HAMP domain-containing protein/ActR/RegA family two-component response regulator